VVADISCPFCFLGKKRLEQALLRLDGQRSPEISWQPLELSPEIPRQGLPLDEFLMRRFGGRQTVTPALDQLQSMGQDAGIQFRFDLIDRVPNTLDAHRLIRLATLQGQQESMVQQLYSAYFERGLDVGRREILSQLAGEVGLSVTETRDYLRSKQGIDTVRGIEALHRRNGTNGVPIFLLNGFVSVEGAQEVDILVKALDFALFRAEPSSIDSGQLH
jgi:predicted DsbA family dithiol-disulfide isomerase